MIKAVGYVRVSTMRQAKEGESLTTQRKALQDYAKHNQYDLIEIYADEGISGGSVEKRPGLQRLLQDAQNQGFERVFIHRLSRLGRNARELLNNVELLKKIGVSVFFLKENIDLSNAYGQFMLTMLAAMAELEKDISGESSVENKIARAKQGVPSTGKYPFGRRFNRKTGEWYFDPPDIKEVVEGIADRYLNGEGLRDIADNIPGHYQLTYSNILKVFHGLCGDTWNVKFKKEDEPIVYNVPRLLSDEKIEAVKKRIGFNKTFTKANRKQHTFLLSGFAWCMECGRALTAQHQKHKISNKPNSKDYIYKYYRHPAGKREKCRALTSIAIKQLEKTVLTSIWENLSDEDSGFNDAWGDNYPDQGKIDKLRKNIEANRKALAVAEIDRDKLVNALLKGILSEDAIKVKNDSLSREIARLKDRLSKDEERLKRVPSPEEIERQEKKLKMAFQDFYYSRERFDSMSFDECRALMFSIFDGVDDEGKPLGVYVKRISTIGELPVRFEYYINARFFAGYLESDPNDESGPVQPDPLDFSSNPTGIKTCDGYKTKSLSLNHRHHRQRMHAGPLGRRSNASLCGDSCQGG